MADQWGERMPRSVGLLQTVAVSVGVAIGSGIFRVPATVAGQLGTPGPILLCWILGGVIALCGALTAGTIGLICLLLATGISLKLLTAESFHISDIATQPDLEKRLDRHAIDVLPPEYETVRDFTSKRERAIVVLRKHASDRDTSEYKETQQFLQAINEPLSRLVSLAQFESMRMSFDRSMPFLFLLALGALASLGSFAVLVGSAKDSKASAMTGGPVVPLNLSAVANAYSLVCGAANHIDAEIVGQPRQHWLTLRIMSPGECSGIVLSVPATVITQASASVGAPIVVSDTPATGSVEAQRAAGKDSAGPRK